MFDNDTQSVEAVQEVAAQPAQESSKESNMRYMRERAEAAERRAQELENYMRQQQQAQQQPRQAESEDFGFDDDSYIEGKQFKKYVKSLREEVQQSKKELQEATSKALATSAHSSLKSDYKDFDDVVSEDNLNRLARTKPYLHRSLMSNPDLRERGATAYEMIKAAGLYDREANEADRRIEENKNKPKNAAVLSPTTGETPLSKVADYERRVLTKDYKEALLKNMEEAKKNRV